MAEHDSPLTYEKGKVYELIIDDIQPNPYQPRTFFDKNAINELAKSINTSGLHEPILFRVEDGKPVLVAGGRRLLAHQKLKRKTIPALLTEGDPKEVSLIENLVREDITAIEEAQAMKAMTVQHGYSQEQLAAFLGKSAPSISQSIKITEINERLLKEIEKDNPKCPRWILYEVAKQDNKKQRGTYNKFHKKGLTREEFRKGATKPNPKQPLYITKDLAKKLATLDITDWKEDDRLKFFEALEMLKDSVSKFLINKPE